MRCPKCGSSAAAQVALGAFVCDAMSRDVTSVRIHEGRMDPHDPRIPGVQYGAAVRWIKCGHSWFDPTVVAQAQAQQGAEMVVCECGDLAVGKCVDCMKPVCVRHSRIHDDHRLCADHAPVIVVNPEPEDAPLGWNDRIARSRERQADWLVARSNPGLMEDLYGRLVRAITDLNPTDFVVEDATSAPAHRELRRIGPFRRPPKIIPESKLVTTHHCHGWLVRNYQYRVDSGDADMAGAWIRREQGSIVLGSDGGWWLCTEILESFRGGRVGSRSAVDLRVHPEQLGSGRMSIVGGSRPKNGLKEVHIETEKFMRKINISPSDLGIADWPAVPGTMRNKIPNPFRRYDDEITLWS